MTSQDKKEFKQYLCQCSDRQVLGVWEKEKAANRRDYATLARMEAERRGII